MTLAEIGKTPPDVIYMLVHTCKGLGAAAQYHDSAPKGSCSTQAVSTAALAMTVCCAGATVVMRSA